MPTEPPETLSVRRDLHSVQVEIPATWQTSTALFVWLWMAANVLLPVGGWVLFGLPVWVGLLPGVVLMPITLSFLWYLYQRRATWVEVSPYALSLSRFRLLPIDPPKLLVPLQRIKAVHLRRFVPMDMTDELIANYPHIEVVLEDEEEPLRLLQGHQQQQVAWIAGTLRDAAQQSRKIEGDGIGSPHDIPTSLQTLIGSPQPD